jgi:hypothetical protein
MPFPFLGTLRQQQWKAFRDWTLNERRSVDPRIKAIDAELKRIGRITVFYKTAQEVVQTPGGAEREIGVVTEERQRFVVSTGSSLEKLVQCYVACGGNPMSISLWLQPDELQFTTAEDPIEDSDDDPNEAFTDVGSETNPYDQPMGGVAAVQSGDYGEGGFYAGGRSTMIRDTVNQIGRYIQEGDAGAKVAIRMDFARRWVGQELAMLGRIEAKIIKLMDLREQLMRERDVIVQQAIGGSVNPYPIPPDTTRFARNLHLCTICRDMDGVFYETDENGEPDFTKPALGTGENPGPLARYDTLLGDPRGTDKNTGDGA